MTQRAYHTEGWPALMSTEMAARYLSISDEALRRLTAMHSVGAVEIEDAGLRWRKQDLDRLVKKLPLVSAIAISERPSRLIRLDDQQIEAIAKAVSARLAAAPSLNDRQLVSIREACSLLGLGRSSVYRLIGEGRLETRRIGRRTLLRAESVREMISGA